MIDTALSNLKAKVEEIATKNKRRKALPPSSFVCRKFSLPQINTTFKLEGRGEVSMIYFGTGAYGRGDNPVEVFIDGVKVREKDDDANGLLLFGSYYFSPGSSSVHSESFQAQLRQDDRVPASLDEPLVFEKSVEIRSQKSDGGIDGAICYNLY